MFYFNLILQLADGQSLFDYDVGLNDIIQIFVRPKVLPETNGHSEPNGHSETNGHSESNGHSEENKINGLSLTNGHTEVNGHSETNGHTEVNGCAKTVNGEPVTTPTSNGSTEEAMETV